MSPGSLAEEGRCPTGEPEGEDDQLSRCWRIIQESGPGSAEARDAFRRGFEQWYPYLRDLAAEQVGELHRAEVRQETVLQLWQALCRAPEPLRNPGAFIAVLLARARARYSPSTAAAAASARKGGAVVALEEEARRVERLIELVEVGAAMDSVSQEIMNEDVEQLWQAIHRLPLSLQQCLVCRRVLGLSVAETQVLLGLEREQVMRRTERAHRVLLELAGSAGISRR